MRRSLLTSLGGVTAALVGSLCCTGPLLFVTLGVGAGLASTFEPLRPVFGAAMLGFFAFGFHRAYARRRVATIEPSAAIQHDGDSSGSAGACELPRRRDRDVVILWVAAVVAFVLWTFPSWSQLLL